jgi:hypothetical protein
MNMPTWKKILIGFSLIAFLGAAGGYYLYNKKPADVRRLQPDLSVTANSLIVAFNSDEVAANLKYLDKVIAVKGIIADIKIDSSTGQASVILDSGDPLSAVTCSFYNDEIGAVQKLSMGTEVVIKGKCTGKLMDVVLNNCSIIQ